MRSSESCSVCPARANDRWTGSRREGYLLINASLQAVKDLHPPTRHQKPRSMPVLCDPFDLFHTATFLRESAAALLDAGSDFTRATHTTDSSAVQVSEAKALFRFEEFVFPDTTCFLHNCQVGAACCKPGVEEKTETLRVDPSCLSIFCLKLHFCSTIPNSDMAHRFISQGGRRKF